MKKFTALLFSLSLLLSCTPQAYRSSFVIDYRPFADAGFFVTESNSISFSYHPIASVSSIYRSGMAKYGQRAENSEDPLYSSISTNIDYATPEGVLAILVSKCKELGANGVINLKITKYETMWEASGMAIKIER